MGWLSSILSILASALGWGREKDARANTPEMVANKVAQQDNAEAIRIAKEEAAARDDDAALEQLRKDAAE